LSGSHQTKRFSFGQISGSHTDQVPALTIYTRDQKHPSLVQSSVSCRHQHNIDDKKTAKMAGQDKTPSKHSFQTVESQKRFMAALLASVPNMKIDYNGELERAYFVFCRAIPPKSPLLEILSDALQHFSEASQHSVRGLT
jgi:hypothetical protein